MFRVVAPVILNIPSESSEDQQDGGGNSKPRKAQQDDGGDGAQICLLEVFIPERLDQLIAPPSGPWIPTRWFWTALANLLNFWCLWQGTWPMQSHCVWGGFDRICVKSLVLWWPIMNVKYHSSLGAMFPLYELVSWRCTWFISLLTHQGVQHLDSLAKGMTHITEFWKFLVTATVLSGRWEMYMLPVPGCFSDCGGY